MPPEAAFRAFFFFVEVRYQKSFLAYHQMDGVIIVNLKVDFMEIDGIFTLVPDSLYSVQFAGEMQHELSRIFRLWNDMGYLESFFNAHYADLLAFWENMSVEDAAELTRDEAHDLEKKILAVAHAGVWGSVDNLSSMFRPLHAGTTTVENLEKSKVRGSRRRSWLRVYAVRMDVNKFVISGGAIKLTRTMNEREHLAQELIKLERVCQFLKEDQKNEFGLFELF